MAKPRRTLATVGARSAADTDAAAERALASHLTRPIIHLRGCLEEPMWPTLAAFEIGELTGIAPDDIKALADQGWMPAACYIREGDRFAFRASAVAWAYAYLATCLGTGLMTLAVDSEGTHADIDMVARPAQAAEARTWLARLTPAILDSAFKVEVLRPGGLALLEHEFEFAPFVAGAAEVWWNWIAARSPLP